MLHLAIHLPEEALLRGSVQFGWMYPVERRLGYLKGTVRNKAQPKGSIAEGYIVDECMTFCSRWFSKDIETRFNKDERNQDRVHKVRRGEFAIFSDGAKPLGKPTLLEFPREYKKMVWYVLNNCEEEKGYIE